MGTVYEKASADVKGLLKQVIEKHHQELDALQVRVGVLMASNAEDDNPVKLHGYPCAAVVRIVPYRQRVHGMPDAEIVVDQKQWDEFSERQQRALLDHELTHLEVKHDEDGHPVTDDQGRPKLKMKLHDWQLGGFASIAKRYKDDALEVQAAQKFQQNYGQLVFDFAETVAA